MQYWGQYLIPQNNEVVLSGVSTRNNHASIVAASGVGGGGHHHNLSLRTSSKNQKGTPKNAGGASATNATPAQGSSSAKNLRASGGNAGDSSNRAQNGT